MKRVYAVQLSNWFPDASLPQAIATIWNFATNDPIIKSNYSLIDVFWQNETSEEIISCIENPEILMCSCYVWNWEITYEVIKCVKKIYPNCLVIIGGPEPKYTTEWVSEHPEVDVLVAYYGEVTFKEILLEHLTGKNNFSKIPGTVTSNKNNKDSFVYPNLNDIPSPYLNGFFDNLLLKKKLSIKSIRAVFETNRGCPYSCAFCDLGAEQYRKVKQFDTDRCLQELEWIVKNKINSIDVADSNFGIFLRDEKFVDHLIDLKTQFGYNGSFLPTWSKTKGKHILNLGKKIIKSGLDSMFNISIQSTNQDTLNIVNRTNTFDFDDLSNVISYFHKDNIDVYTDLIFPMPGDTLQSIKVGLGNLIDLPNTFDKIQMNHLSRLTNTPMNSEKFKNHKIEWSLIKGNSKHYYGDTKDTLAISTSKMSKDDVFEAIFYAKCCYQPFYYYGIFRNLISNYAFLGYQSKSQIIDMLIDCAYRMPWFVTFKESVKEHYFSAINNRTHFGYKLIDDKEQYFPEYAYAYIQYMQHEIHDNLKNLLKPMYHEIIDFDKLSHWNNKPGISSLECKIWNTGCWIFTDERKLKDIDFYKKIFIRGRFTDQWKVQDIKKCQ